MKKSLGIVLALFLMAALSVPAMGATLSVSGKYVAEIWYDGGEIASKNPATWCADHNWPCFGEGVDLMNMSTLYLNLDFSVDETLSAHIPLRLYKDTELEVDQNPDDNYKFVFKGAPLTLSLTDAESGDYFFSSFGDPLGLVWAIPSTDDNDYATFKAAGQPFGIGFTGYLIATDPTGTTDHPTYPRYALARATYGLSSGHTLGAIYATKQASGDTQIANFEVDAAGPLYITEGATFTTALAISKTQDADGWDDPVNAFELNLAGINMGGVTLSGNVRAVDPNFEAVLPDNDDSGADSDAADFKGKRQIQGEAVTNINLGGLPAILTVGDDYRVDYDGEISDTSTNKVSGSVKFNPSEPVTITVGGYYTNWLTNEGPIADDFKGNVYGKAEYKIADVLTVSGGAQWMTANLYDAGDPGDPEAQPPVPPIPAVDREGTGIKLDGSVEAKPAAGVLIKGTAEYQTGKYDFIDADNLRDATDSRLDGEVYGEAKQTFVTAGVKQVDTVLAGLARGTELSSADAKRTYVGYAEANVKISDQFADKVAVLTGNSTEDDYKDHYKTTVRNEFTYRLSPDSTLGIGYTWKDAVSTWDASYTVALGDATMKLSYGASGLASDPCDTDFDDGRPWAWLCNASVPSTPNTTYKLVVTIPF